MAEPLGDWVNTANAEDSESYGCVVVAQLAVQSAMRVRPHLKKNAVVVMEGKRPLERVCSLNRIAERIGLRHGMSRVEVETFSDVQVLTRSTAEEDVARAVLLEAMGAFSPRIETRAVGVDWECVLDLTGTARLLGDSAAVGRSIVVQIEKLGFHGVITVSENVDAGVLVARALAWGLPTATILHPGVSVIPKADVVKALAGLPLSVLKLDEEVAEKFELWGIRTLGELASLPESALIARMGQAGKRLLFRATGELPHLLKPVLDEVVLEESLELQAAAETLEPLLFVLNPMLEQLCATAAQQALAIAAVTVEFKLEKKIETSRAATEIPGAVRKENEVEAGTRFLREIRPAVPTLDRKLLLKLLQLELEAHPAPAAVQHVTLRAEAGKSSRIQIGLFEPPMPEPTRFEDTYARLVSVIGEGNVGRVKLLDTHEAESFALERFYLPGPGYKASLAREVGLKPGMALRRMRPPVSIDVELRGQEILRFWFETQSYEAVRCFGPWRSSGNWWCGQVWSVDTWDVAARAEDEELLICLVGHDLLKQSWVLEGIYD